MHKFRYRLYRAIFTVESGDVYLSIKELHSDMLLCMHNQFYTLNFLFLFG